MKLQSDSGKKHMIKTTLAMMMIVFTCFLSSCNTTETSTDYITETLTDNTTENWIDSITDENGVYIGQDKEVVGYYKRIGIVKSGETYEDMLELRDTEKQGYLVANDDGTAFFELDGEKTEFVFDSAYFYSSDDTERTNGFRYTCINGRLIIDDGTTITQYLRLTDEELASCLESSKTDTLQFSEQQIKDSEAGENNGEEEIIMTMKIGESPVQVDWEDNESVEALRNLAKQGDIQPNRQAVRKP